MEKNIDIFNTSKEWIVTKNVDGKTKVSARKEHELYEQTTDDFELEDDNGEILYKSNELFTKTKCVRLFIRDIITANKTCDYFTFKTISFQIVELYGTVTSVYTHGNKKCIVVDDGTSSIICMIDIGYGDSEKERCKSELDELYEVLDENSNSVLVKAAIMMKRGSKEILAKIPDFEKMKLGDRVKVIGKLTEFNNNKYVFIHKIFIDNNVAGMITHLKDIIYLYENVY